MSSILLDGLFGNMLVFILGGMVALGAGRAIGSGDGRALALYAWHALFALLYVRILQDMSGDALGYYYKAIAHGYEWRPGSGFVQGVTAFLAHDLGLSFTAISLAFATAGAVGLHCFDRALRNASDGKAAWARRLAAALPFLPSASFWTSSLGKDSVAMLATGLFVLAAWGGRRQALLLSLAIVIMFCVRPHMAALMIAIIMFASVMGSSWRLPARLGLGGLALIGALAVAPYVLTYAGIGDNPDQAAIEDFVAQRQAVNLGGGSSIDIVAMNPAERIFAYLFRPLPHEAASLLSVVAAAENALFLLAAALGVFWFATGRNAPTAPVHTMLLIAYAAVSLLVLSQTTANLGIAVRQKWMILPMLLTLVTCYAPAVRPQPVTRSLLAR